MTSEETHKEWSMLLMSAGMVSTTTCRASHAAIASDEGCS